MRQIVYTSLLVITLCGERKISSTIKKSQNNMNMIGARLLRYLTSAESEEVALWAEVKLLYITFDIC